MPSLAELRKKIKGIGATRKITKAMKMVAGARFGRAQGLANGSRKFVQEIDAVISEIIAIAGADQEVTKLLCGQNCGPDRKIALVVVTADKGLCGDFNNSVMKEADRFLKREATFMGAVFAVGKKACDHYRKIFPSALNEYAGIFNTLDYLTADRIVGDIIASMNSKGITEVKVISGGFKSMMKHEVTTKQLIPFVTNKPAKVRDWLLEPMDYSELLSGLLPMVLKNRLYSMLRDSYAASLAAQLRAMDSATSNAGTLIEKVTLEMNKVRQAIITREIAEIIGTNEVVK